MKKILVSAGFMVSFVLTGCASAVYNYDYRNPSSGYEYPEFVSVNYFPGYMPISNDEYTRVSVGMDLAYGMLPMGSNLFVYNKNLFLSLRIGDQWSTTDNEVLGLSGMAGYNYYMNKGSIITIGVSYTAMDLTPGGIVRGGLKGANLKFSRIIASNENTSFLLDPKIASVYFLNSLRIYDYTATIERHVYDSTSLDYTRHIFRPHFRYNLFAFALGLDLDYSVFKWYAELGRVFPEYVNDDSGNYSIKYDFYLSSGFYLNF